MRQILSVRLSATAVLAVVAVIAAACGGDQPEPSTETGAPEPTAAPATNDEEVPEEPADEAEAVDPTEDAAEGAGGTLVVAISQDPAILNPAITTQGGTHTASEIMFNGLLRFTEDLEVEPDLAERWEISDDGATYTFTLRDDVVWHDGEPFTSEDVRFTFEEALLELHSRTAASMGGVLESIETPDDTTVVFRFTQPYAPLLQQLDVSEAPIIPAHAFEGVEDIQEAGFNTAPIGTGPFRFVSYTPDQEIRLERNPDYFREGLPRLDALVMQVIPEASSQVIALEAGEVDFLWGVPGPDLERLEASDDYEFLQTSVNPGGANCIMTVSFNLDQPILADLAVRRAFAHAIDRQVIVDRVLFGAGRVAEAPISSGIPFAHVPDLDLPEHDPAAAEQQLEDAGWVRDGDGVRTAQGVDGVDDGTPLALRFVAFPTFSAYGEVFREQLADVGIDLTLESVEQAAFVEQVFTERDFDTNIISYCNATDPEIGVRRMYLSSNIGPVPFSNAAGYVNEDVDGLFDAARAEVDPDARTDLYRQISETVIEELPYWWIVETEGVRVHTADCEGFLPFGLFAEAASCDG